jgi:uncharacterized protein YdaU (DUF1376 family)
MRRETNWMPMFWGDYARDTGNLSAIGHGAYLMLIKHYWCTAAPLRDDDDELWRIACCDSRDQWLALRPTLARFFDVAEGMWRHKRVDRELGRAAETTRKRSEAAKAGAAKRAADREATESAHAQQMPSICSAHAQQTDQQNPGTLHAIATPLHQHSDSEESAMRSPEAARGIRKSNGSGSGISGNSGSGAARRWRDQGNRDAYAAVRIAEVVGWDVMGAAEDPNNQAHALAVKRCRQVAAELGIGWVSPERRNASA